jgi:hypothetical protein
MGDAVPEWKFDVDRMTPAQKAALPKLWKAGVLSWRLDPAQRIMHRDILAKRGRDRLVVLAGRGWGKTFVTLAVCIEQCLQKPNQAVAFVTKTKGQARANLRLSADTILETCPRHLKPRFLKNDGEYVFPNGSVLSLLGVDSERFDVIRGRALHGVLIDEAQDIEQLEHIVKSVLEPAAARVDGWVILSGTSPKKARNEFVGFINEAHGLGTALVYTIHQCPRYKPAQIEEWKRRAGGEDSTVWKREYLCELVFDEETRVIPEWTPTRAQSLVREEPRPQHYDRYCSIDFGFSRDLTVVLFGHYNYPKATVVIEDELVLKGCTTETLSKAIDAKMVGLGWGNADERGKIYGFADGNEPRTIYEMRVLHNLSFTPTEKVGKRMQINLLRMLVTNGEIVISPKCRTLVKTLFTASWNPKHESFDRDDETGHADALDALLYMTRNVQRNRNPFPRGDTWLVRDGFQAARPQRTTSTGAKSFTQALMAGRPRRTRR